MNDIAALRPSSPGFQSAECQHHQGTHGKTSGFLRLTLGMTVAANKNPTVVLGKHFETSSFKTKKTSNEKRLGSTYMNIASGP